MTLQRGSKPKAHTTDSLREIMLLAAKSAQVIMGLDLSMRTGLKAVIINPKGRHIDYEKVFPFSPQGQWYPAIVALAKLAVKHNIALIAIGNGREARDTERLVQQLIAMYPDLGLQQVGVPQAETEIPAVTEKPPRSPKASQPINTAMADALAKLKEGIATR